MGMFSWDCKVCGHPMLSHGATEDKNEWMKQVVVIEPDGSILRGEYGGYGDVGEHETIYDGECYHEHCWKLAGSPIEYTESSRNSNDQGWFFPNNYHNIEPPTEIPEKLCERYSIFSPKSNEWLKKYIEGAAAFDEGKQLEDNPYEDGEIEYAEWYNGWYDKSKGRYEEPKLVEENA